MAWCSIPGISSREVEKLRGQGVEITPDTLKIADTCAADPAASTAISTRCARMPAAPARSAPRGAASARPMRTRSAAARSGCAISRISTISTPQLDRLCAHHDALRAGFGEPPIDRAALLAELREIAGFVLPFAAPVWRTLARGARARPAHPVRRRAGRAARRRSRHLSVRHLVEHGGGHGGGGHRARARTRSASCSASPRPIRRASARARSRPSRTMRSASGSARAGTSSAPSPGASGAAAGSMRCWCASRRRSAAITGIALTKLDVLDGFEEVEDLHRLHGCAARRSIILPPNAAGSGRGRAGLRDDAGLERIDRGRAQLGRAAGAGDQIYPPHRGADPAARWRWSRPAPSARTRSSCAIRSRTDPAEAPARRFAACGRCEAHQRPLRLRGGRRRSGVGARRRRLPGWAPAPSLGFTAVLCAIESRAPSVSLGRGYALILGIGLRWRLRLPRGNLAQARRLIRTGRAGLAKSSDA